MTVVGLGYMGLPTALLLARSGITVYGYDANHKRIEMLEKGILPFQEPGLQDLFRDAENSFIPIKQLQCSDVFILALPTPITMEKTCDISFVVSAVQAVCDVVKDDDLIILESTVPPGTTAGIVRSLLEKTGKRFFLSYVSEKALPGDTIREMQQNHRIIGGLCEEAAKRTKEIYQRFVTAPIHLTDCTTAESVKLLENTFRDVNIALANELAITLSKVGINIWEAIELANHHPRVHIHRPGPGVGGHCIAVDPWFLVTDDTKLILQARMVNDAMPSFVVQMIEAMLGDVSHSVIVLLGVAYKGNIDDDRESPSYSIKQILEEKGHTVRLYDPYITNQDIKGLSEVTKDSDCLVLVTDHDVFKDIDPKKIQNMNRKLLLDTRHILSYDAWVNAGFFVKVLGL